VERFGAGRGGLGGRPAAEFVATIAGDVAAFRGSAEPSDDLTLLVARRDAAPGG
jgi:hypothetical protein